MRRLFCLVWIMQALILYVNVIGADKLSSCCASENRLLACRTPRGSSTAANASLGRDVNSLL